MLTSRFTGFLIVALTLALTASRAEAQELGCWADDDGDGNPVCERRQRRCGPGLDCTAAGDSCIGGVCEITLRDECAPCLPRANTCPGTFEGFERVITADRARCTYLFPCGASFVFTEEGPALSDSLCFLGSDRATPVLFPDGDCDGDGVTNRIEEASIRPTDACVSVVTPEGLSSDPSHLRAVGSAGTGAPGLDVAEPTRPVPFVGIRCDEDQRCPDGAPDSPIKGRCVYVTAAYGVCLYSDLDPHRDQLPREDRSCEAVSSPLPMRFTTREMLQAGDYDADGIPNADDPEVCEKVEVVALSGGMLQHASSTLIDGCPATGGARVVLPDNRCANPAAPNAFGVACSERDECPVVSESRVRTEVRCVEFPGSGVCVYGGGTEVDDSCTRATNFSSCGFDGDGYAAFAGADCDGMTNNFMDAQMCTPPVPDGGMSGDAGALADADASALADAFSADPDAFVREPPPDVTFGGGGGCACSVGGRKPGPGSALFALGFLGAFWVRRRRSEVA